MTHGASDDDGEYICGMALVVRDETYEELNGVDASLTLRDDDGAKSSCLKRDRAAEDDVADVLAPTRHLDAKPPIAWDDDREGETRIDAVSLPVVARVQVEHVHHEKRLDLRPGAEDVGQVPPNTEEEVRAHERNELRVRDWVEHSEAGSHEVSVGVEQDASDRLERLGHDGGPDLFNRHRSLMKDKVLAGCIKGRGCMERRRPTVHEGGHRRRHLACRLCEAPSFLGQDARVVQKH